MALITRVSRLFRADLHAVLDRMEEPSVLLRQALREMEAELVQEQQRSKLLAHERQQIGVRAVELEQALKAIETKLDVCFESAEESLARTQIRRRLETRQLLNSLDQKRENLSREQLALEDRIADHRSRLDQMRQQLELLAEDNPVAEPGDVWGNDWACRPGGVSDADVEVAYLQELQNRRPA